MDWKYTGVLPTCKITSINTTLCMQTQCKMCLAFNTIFFCHKLLFDCKKKKKAKAKNFHTMNGWLSPSGSRWYHRVFPGSIAEDYSGLPPLQNSSSVYSMEVKAHLKVDRKIKIIWGSAWQSQQNEFCVRTAWASAQTDQSLRYPHEETLGP